MKFRCKDEGKNMLTGPELVLVADGASARFFERATPNSRLMDLPVHHLEIGRHHAHRDHGDSGQAADRRQTSHKAREQAFIETVGERLNEVASDKRFRHLVICAPHKALGLLREKLGVALREKLTLSLSKDLSKEALADLDARLRELRV
ncbi:conserved hypothetical protein [uncultured Defluviicoccus sp.]|uniref:Host attachment protein n=1 Tax=metagenome TaxID=256318 RepID=A0A380T9N2_9ZZZZ|nr:conserved hypothetical protein [uncultured Defluviicoccus sp.]